MQEKIKSYIFKGDDAQVIMDADVAKEVKLAMESYWAGVEAGGDAGGCSYAKRNIKMFTGRYIAKKFLDDKSKEAAQNSYVIFYETVKAKVEELTET